MQNYFLVIKKFQDLFLNSSALDLKSSRNFKILFWGFGLYPQLLKCLVHFTELFFFSSDQVLGDFRRYINYQKSLMNSLLVL